MLYRLSYARVTGPDGDTVGTNPTAPDPEKIALRPFPGQGARGIPRGTAERAPGKASGRLL
jgi:hypothetical protein